MWHGSSEWTHCWELRKSALQYDQQRGPKHFDAIWSIGKFLAWIQPILPFSIPGKVYSGTNFRGMFGKGAGYTANAFFGDAGNYAYAAVSAHIGVSYFVTELAAAGYSWTHHTPSDWVGPLGMDPSATVQVPAGYGASCKGY